MKKKLNEGNIAPPLLTKINRVMKITALLIVFGIVNVMASNSYSQKARISLNMNDASLEMVLDEIENQSEFYFLFNQKLIDSNRKVRVNAENQKIETILNELFVGTKVNYVVFDRQIVLTTTAVEDLSQGMNSSISRTEMIQQEKEIIGTVTSADDGSGLPGVNVIVKGTSSGTVTDVDGNYKLSIASGSAVLSFSYVGYMEENIAVGNKSIIDVELAPDITALEEIVVIGYGTMKKSDLTGSVGSVKTEELVQGVAPSASQLLSGRVAGVRVVQASAEPGGANFIRIRGANSINASNNPLYVIDGMPMDNSAVITGSGSGIAGNNTPRDPLSTINPADIESIEILKDASAAAIYGSRGANGVVLITTKKGVKGKLKIDYNGNVGVQQVARSLDVLEAHDFAQAVNDISVAEGSAPIYDMNEIGEGTNWFDEITRTGSIQNHTLGISGGSDNTNYFASMNYYDHQGIVKSSGMKRYTGRINLESKLSEKFKIGLNLNTSHVEDDYVPYGNAANANAGIISTSIQMDPTLPIYNDDGTYFQSYDIDHDNPYIISEIYMVGETDRTIVSTFAEYSFLPELKLKVKLGADRSNSRRDTYVSTDAKQGAGVGGIATILTGNKSSKLFETTLNYAKSFNNHSLNLLGGYTFEEFGNMGFSGNITGFPSDVTLTNNLNLGDTELDNLNSYKNSNTLISYIGRANYSYNSKYMATASIRADGSSRFGENNKFAYFPSAAVAWRLSEEAFMQNVSSIDNLKIRASWGVTGNQGIGNYASLSTLSAGGVAVMNGVLVQGIAPTRIPNPDLKWETTEQLNLGFDIGLFDSRLSLTVDYFEKTTEDMLLNLPIPGTSGFNSILTNIGSIQNKGLEFLLESWNITGKDFSWNTKLNFSKIKNEVIGLGSVDEIITGNLPFTQGVSIIRPGEELNSYYGMFVDGIFQEGDDIANSAQPGSAPGQPIFRDISGADGVPDGQINDDDKTIIGSPWPDLIFGIDNILTYKKFEFSFFVTGEFGAEILNQNLIETFYPIEGRRNRLGKPILNRWTTENPSNEYPSGVNATSYGGSKVNSLSIQDASFVRLKNVKLAYAFDVTNVSFLQGASVYVLGDNLLLWTNYDGFDPEVNSFGNSNVRADYNPYPAAKTVMLGVNLTF